MFVCRIKSGKFSRGDATCHFGPFPEITPKTPVTMPYFEMVNTTVKTKSSTTKTPTRSEIHNTSLSCQSVCPATSSKTTFWIVSTTITSAISVLMCAFILAVWLKCREIKQHHTSRPNMSPSLRPVRKRERHEGVYAQLDYKRDINKLYMTLKSGEPVRTQNTGDVDKDTEHRVALMQVSNSKSRYV